MNSQIHLHSKFSLNDGTGEPVEIEKRLREIGATAIALTDHGVMMGVAEFNAVFANSPVRFIPGIEAYANFGGTEREHLIVLPIDNIGMHGMMKCFSTAFVGYETSGFPIVTRETLEKYFGNGREFHGHVLCTSACIQGPVAIEFLRNAHLEREALKQEKKAETYVSTVSDYGRLLEDLEKLTANRDRLTEERKRLSELKSKTYKKRQNDLKKLEGTDGYEDAKAALEAEMAESTRAEASYATARGEESAAGKLVTAKKDEVRKLDAKIARYNELMGKAEEFRNQKISDEAAYNNARAKAQTLIDIFGKENVYCEIQYHGIPEEEIAYPGVVRIAKELGLKIVASNDCHYVYNTEDEREKRRYLRSLRFNKYEEDRIGDSEYYIKTDEELKECLLHILPEDVVDEALSEKERALARCDVTKEEVKDYPKFETEPGETSEQRLQKLIKEGKEKLFPGKSGWNKEYRDRVVYELEVMKKLQVIDYILVVADFLEYGRLVGKIDVNSEEFKNDPFNIDNLRKLAKGNVGMGIGIGRGSGAGSLICYLVGITDIDPLKYGLIFERFLNPNRVSMPDIDSDLSPEIRELVIDYVKHKYGQKAVCGIMTLGTQAAKNSIRNVARIYGDKKYHDSKALYKLGSEICDEIPNEPKVVLKDYVARLKEKFGDNEDALEIIRVAQLIEGTPTTIGQHAAGVIIAGGGDVRERVPIMKSKDGLWITQYDMTYIEDYGLLKFDFLGLKNLGIITETLRSIKRNYGKNIDVHDIPLDDVEVYKNIFDNGNTKSVFQFESQGMSKLLVNFHPDVIEHLMLLNALYRPGPLQNADALCDAKRDFTRIPRSVTPEVKEILAETYGFPVYQENIMQICNKAAGFTLSEADDVRKCMSKKKMEKLLGYHDKFVNGLVEHGAIEKEAEDFWKQLIAFGEYAFNKSHAAVYAITAYYTGWLKYHYPKEYMASVMNWEDFDGLSAVITDAVKSGTKTVTPDINVSDYACTPSKEKDEIIFGLSKIKGVASFASEIVKERKNGLFTSFDDFVSRMKNCSSDVLKFLIQSGCFDSLNAGSNMSAWEYRKLLLEKSGYTDVPETKTKMLFAEKALVSTFLSDSPTAEYKGVNTVADVVNLAPVKRNYSVIGVVTDFRKITTKKGSEMATFTLSDTTASIEVCCFPSMYEKFRSVLHDDDIFQIEGYRKAPTDGDDRMQMIAESASVAKPSVKYFLLIGDAEHGNSFFKPIVDKYASSADNGGVPVYLKFRSGGSRLLGYVNLMFSSDKSVASHIVIGTV